MKTTALAEIIEREFSYLSARYGFGKLKVRDLGLKVFFELYRGLEAISVSVEIGTAPLIEIFVPAEETNEKATPWAKKAGVPRARLFPKLDCSKQHNLKDLTAYESCIAEIAREFELSQEEWLHA